MGLKAAGRNPTVRELAKARSGRQAG